ncbi:MAG TPA: VC0807 family protein [Candidatus Angelobacter sp.]|nr:VC0807 family protein [Candidatus Angelobacter sp.]
MQALPTPTQEARPPVRSIAWGIFLNAAVPVILYKLARRYFSASEFAALVVAAMFPLGKSAYGLVRGRQLDPISILVLLGIVTDAIAMLFGGSPRLLLVRESMFTGAFGVACLVSLLLPRPMMFYFSRYFIAGTDPVRQARFNASWQFPDVRFCHRLITTVWGFVFLGELILRIILIYQLPAAVVLVVSPILIGVLTIATMVWAFRYGHQVRLRVLARLNNAEAAATGALSPPGSP